MDRSSPVRYRSGAPPWVLGAGKAAASMGKAVEGILGRYLTGGILATKYGHSLALKKLEIVEATHPLPDANNLAAAQAAKRLGFTSSFSQAGSKEITEKPHDST
jgi:glycerate 2-kinase